jgi:hypothetical protein
MSIVQMPAEHVYHHLSETEITTVFEYNILTVVETSGPVDCGAPELFFHTWTGMQLSEPFSLISDGNFDFLTVESNDVNEAGSYQLQFTFFYGLRPDITITSPVFTVTIVNPCMPPPGCINIEGCGISAPTLFAPMLEMIHYTITEPLVTYEFLPWTCGIAECDAQIVYSTLTEVTGDAGLAVMFTGHSLEVYYSGATDLGGVTTSGIQHTVEIVATLGYEVSVANCEVFIYNPCIDSAYLTVSAAEMEDIVYTMYETSLFTHEAFTIHAESQILEICGRLSYTIEAGYLTQYVHQKTQDCTFEIFTEDRVVLDNMVYTYTVTAVLEQYPECENCRVSASGQISIVNPCLEIQNLAFDGTQTYSAMPDASMTPALLVDPPQCVNQIEAEC